jgi:MFS family permease
MLALTGVQTAMRGALAVVTVVVAIDVLGTGESGAGTLMAAVGAGALVGSLAAALLVGSRRLARWFGTGVALWGLPLSLIALTDRSALVLGLLMLVGIGNALVDVGLFTLVARLAPDAVLGRVFGVLEAVAALTIAAGAVATPWAFDALGLRDGLLVVGAVAPVSVLVAWRWLRRLDTSMVDRDQDVALLRRIPMLAPLPLPALEHLARGLEPVTVPAGADVVVEGEPGDRFYVLQTGHAEVLGGDQTVTGLGPGDSFGEVALLRRVPRTATVRATTDLVLRALDADRFLTVVTGSPSTRRSATAHVEQLLDRYRPPAPEPGQASRVNSTDTNSWPPPGPE